MTTLADYRRIHGDRYTDEELEQRRLRMRAFVRAMVEWYVEERGVAAQEVGHEREQDV